MFRSLRGRRSTLLLALLPAAALLAACGSGAAGSSGPQGPASTLRIGYFANLTHATALVGLNKGFFAQALGSGTKIETQVFNDGPTEMQALKAGNIDVAFVGPSPAINAYITTEGEVIRIIAGAASGGAELVVKPSINSVADLRGKTIDTPQQGNTQDVALKHFLKQNGINVNADGSGDAKVINMQNSQALTAFHGGDFDAAWLPEPYASTLVEKGGAKVLVDEKTLWPNGEFATTELAASTSFLSAHPQTIDALLTGEIQTNAWIQANPDQAKAAVNAQLASLPGGKKLDTAVLDRAWTELSVTTDPLAATLNTEAENAKSVGLLKQDVNLQGLLDLRELNKVLASGSGGTPQPPVSDAGLSSS